MPLKTFLASNESLYRNMDTSASHFILLQSYTHLLRRLFAESCFSILRFAQMFDLFRFSHIISKGRAKHFPVPGLESTQGISFNGPHSTVMVFLHSVTLSEVFFSLIPFWSFTRFQHIKARLDQNKHKQGMLASAWKDRQGQESKKDSGAGG